MNRILLLLFDILKPKVPFNSFNEVKWFIFRKWFKITTVKELDRWQDYFYKADSEKNKVIMKYLELKKKLSE